MKRKRNFLKRLAAITSAMAFALGGLLLGSTTAAKVYAEETDVKTDGDWEYRVLEDGTAEITGYDGKAKDIEIPGEMDGLVVTSLGYNIFANLETYDSVTVPKSVTHIEKGSFGFAILMDGGLIAMMTALRICGYAGSAAEAYANDNGFKFCDVETEWSYGIWGSNDDEIYILGYNGKKTEIEIPGTIDGKKVVGIQAFAFQSDNLLKSVKLPDSVTYVGPGAFEYCKSLETIIANGEIEIYDNAFSECHSLTNVTMPNVSRVDYMAFSDCASLKTISISGYIGFAAFAGCTSLENVVILSGVESIGDYAFSGCSNLIKVSIPDSVTRIGGNAFYGTPWLESERTKNPIVIVNDVVIDAQTTSGKVSVPEGVTCIENYAFEGCSSLTEVSIPDSVTTIGNSAFSDCSSLTEVSIPDSVTWIGVRAFLGCSSLTEVSIPKEVKNIYEHAFGYYRDEKYNEVKIPDFIIYGYPDTVAEAYAKENGFTFIEIKDESEEKPTEAPTEKPTEAPSDAAITVETTGELASKLEMTNEEIFSAVSKVFTEEQLEAIRMGTTPLDIVFDITNIDSSIAENDKELIGKAVENIPGNDKFNFKVMNYLDLKLGAIIDGKELAVSETDGMITVSVELENPANGTYKVIRIHDGKTDVIDSKLSKDGKRLTFATDKFSTYAIVYSDVASGDSVSAGVIVMLTLGALAAAVLLTVNKFKTVKV